MKGEEKRWIWEWDLSFVYIRREVGWWGFEFCEEMKVSGGGIVIPCGQIVGGGLCTRVRQILNAKSWPLVSLPEIYWQLPLHLSEFWHLSSNSMLVIWSVHVGVGRGTPNITNTLWLIQFLEEKGRVILFQLFGLHIKSKINRWMNSEHGRFSQISKPHQYRDGADSFYIIQI